MVARAREYTPFNRVIIPNDESANKFLENKNNPTPLIRSIHPIQSNKYPEDMFDPIENNPFRKWYNPNPIASRPPTLKVNNVPPITSKKLKIATIKSQYPPVLEFPFGRDA